MTTEKDSSQVMNNITEDTLDKQGDSKDVSKKDYNQENSKLSENSDSKHQELLKGGLLDRSFFSWIRVLIATILWWSFVAGFFSLCYYLFDAIIYPSEDDQPYFVRNLNKYPNILHQPGLNISCEEEGGKCSITISRLLGWTPKVYATVDNPEVTITDKAKANLTDVLQKLGISKVPDNSFPVICYGRKKHDAEVLEGMQIEPPGVFMTTMFPWNGDRENKNGPGKITIDFNGINAFLDKGKDEILTIDCVAVAKNIKTEQRDVDKNIPNGGGTIRLCIKDGKLKSCPKKTR